MVRLYIIHYFRTNEIYSAALFMAGQAPVHPVVQSNKGDVKNSCNLLSAKKLLVPSLFGRDGTGERIIKVFFDGLFNPSPDILFGG